MSNQILSSKVVNLDQVGWWLCT